MIKIEFRRGQLTTDERNTVQAGFDTHSSQVCAPEYQKNELCWLKHDVGNKLVAVLTAQLLWDWLYIDELWVDESVRGQGLGRQLMRMAEEFAVSEKITGLWLWTQSWQAEEFYLGLHYHEFARFPDFPKGHSRIGLRKYVGH